MEQMGISIFNTWWSEIGGNHYVPSIIRSRMTAIASFTRHMPKSRSGPWQHPWMVTSKVPTCQIKENRRQRSFSGNVSLVVILRLSFIKPITSRYIISFPLKANKNSHSLNQRSYYNGRFSIFRKDNYHYRCWRKLRSGGLLVFRGARCKGCRHGQESIHLGRNSQVRQRKGS